MFFNQANASRNVVQRKNSMIRIPVKLKVPYMSLDESRVSKIIKNISMSTTYSKREKNMRSYSMFFFKHKSKHMHVLNFREI